MGLRIVGRPSRKPEIPAAEQWERLAEETRRWATAKGDAPDVDVDEFLHKFRTVLDRQKAEAAGNELMHRRALNLSLTIRSQSQASTSSQRKVDVATLLELL